MTRRALSLLVLLGLLAGACVPVEAGPGDLGDLVGRWQETSGVDAVVVAIGRPGEEPRIVTAGSAEPDDRFRIGSITKTFVAATVLRLAEEGMLSLDDPLGRWVAEPARFGDVTLRQLLGHTSGVPEYTASGDFFEQLDRPWTPEEMIASIDRQAPDFPPGTGWRYSNTNYILLGQVVEAATGEPYGAVVRDLVLDPAGLSTDIGTDLEVTLPGWYDIDHDGLDDDVSTDPYLPTLPWSSGEMVSTAGELARFATVLLTGELLEDESLAAMLAEDPFGQRYGLGLQWSTPDGTTDVVGHGGGVIGYVSVMWWVPSLDRSIVVLLNASGRADPTDLAELVLRRLVDESEEVGPGER